MSSYWSIDSIYPYEKPPFDEVNALIRMVHYTDYKSPGIRKIIINRKLLEKKFIDFGQVFEFNRNDLEEYYKDVIFQRRYHFLPYFDEKYIDFLITARNQQIEEELRGEINSFIKEAKGTESKRSSETNLISKKTDGIIAKIFVFNVGQGDTILVELPNNELWMIDAYFMGASRCSYEYFINWMKKRYGALSIKRLVLSHLHHDHIKSAYRIVEDFRPEEVVLTPTLNHISPAVRNFFRLCPRSILRALTGDEVTNFSGLKLTLKRTADFRGHISLGSDPNNHGIAMIIETEKSFALLPGDIPGHLLCNLNEYYNNAKHKYRFYKVTHHCSHTGNHNAFLTALNPWDAATSCSSSNRFGHPNNPPKDFIDNLTKANLGNHRVTSIVKNDHFLQYEIL